MLYICDMVSVYRVYQAVKDIANKEQKGFVSPAVFNSFAQMAQTNIYNELFQELLTTKRGRLSQLDGGGSRGSRKQVLEDLSYFMRRSVLSPTETAGIFLKPNNLSKLVSIEADSEITQSVNPNAFGSNNYTRCEVIYDTEKANQILSSILSAPTTDFPVALIDYNIEVFPTDISSIRISYYSLPGSINNNGVESILPPSYGYNPNPGDPNTFTFNPAGSRDFMLPPHYLTELVNEIAILICVRLRDTNLKNYADAAEKAE